MNPLIGRIVSLTGAAVTLGSGTAHAQDFFRDFGPSRSSSGFGPVMPSDYTFPETSPRGLRPLTPVDEFEEADRYNFAIGQVRFALAAGIGAEFNDNITLSDNDRLSDIILRPFLGLEGTWRISELNTLRFSLGASYAKYLDHSEFDSEGILLSPTSELVFTFHIGGVKATIRNRVSYQEDAYDVPQLSNVAVYRRWETQHGIQFDWQINEQLDLAFGYDRYYLLPQDDEFSAERRSIDTIFVKPGYQVVPEIRVGVNSAWSWINFDTNERQDGQNLLVGPFIEWQLSDVTNLYLEGGYQRLTYEGESRFDDAFFRELSPEERALFRDASDSSSYYVKFEINNRPTENFRHRLAASKTAEIGFGSNYYDLYHVEYSADWQFLENTRFGPTLFWEYYETSGDRSEQATRIGAALGIRHYLTNSITLGLDYRFLWKDSNVPDSDYYQNLAFLSLYYKF